MESIVSCLPVSSAVACGSCVVVELFLLKVERWNESIVSFLPYRPAGERVRGLLVLQQRNYQHHLPGRAPELQGIAYCPSYARVVGLFMPSPEPSQG
jgi:hypothetical protein